MKVIYMGTPDFAVPALQRIFDAGHEVKLVVTQPDKPRNRGKKLQSTPVKVLAEKLGLSVYQPEKIRGNSELMEKIHEIQPDLIVVVAYGKILPIDLLTVPRFGCINIHGSLLPKYRGPAPIQQALLSDDLETGVTLMYLSEGMDTGDIIDTRTTLINDKTAGDLHQELADLGADMLIDNLPSIQMGTARRLKQDESLASYAPMIFKKDGVIDFNTTSIEIERRIRAMTPWPGAYTFYKGEQMKILSVKNPLAPGLTGPKTSIEKDTQKPGTVKCVSRDGIGIETIDGLIIITRIQMPGKRAMDVSDFLKGNKIEIGTVLG